MVKKIEEEDRIKMLEVALRGYANRNLILAMENKRLMEENEGLKKVLKILEERVIENGWRGFYMELLFCLNKYRIVVNIF